jgi:aldehyde:ferredoxin oxidoreductase
MVRESGSTRRSWAAETVRGRAVVDNGMAGYTGRLLRVLLDRGEVRTEPLDAGIVERYLGGTGYAARILFDEQPAGIDPLGPEARILFSTGPLTTNAVPGGGSVELCFKSPLTGGWGESRSGSDFGPDLRRAGFDHIIVQGRSKSPVYLVVRDGSAELRDATRLAGKTVSEKLDTIRRDLPQGRYSIAAIGPGGENLVRYAGVMFGDRAAGRAGAGAVLGAKNLLAVAVFGSRPVSVHDPDRLREALRKTHGVVRDNPASSAFRDNGTIGDLAGNDEKGDWPTKNWQSNSWGKGAEIFDRYESRNFLEPYPCYRGCSISCGRKVHVPDGPFKTPGHGGAEYESISCFTAYVLNEDMDAAVHSTFLCNEYGIDTISTGASIAFAMECAEKGILGRDALGGLDLSWGNGAVLPILVKMIALRQGVGDLLADGVRAAAARLGPAAEELAVHVKGMEGPAHDPRSGKALAVAYGTANRGMCHIHPVEAMAWDSGKVDWGLTRHGLPDPQGVDRWAEEGKGRAVKLLQDGLGLPDILGTCKFFMYAGVTVEHWAVMLQAITGRLTDAAELLVVAERVHTLERMFNVREGMGRQEDALPVRAGSVPSFGKYRETAECGITNYDAMLQEYYLARGWDPKTGIPTAGTLERLGLA